MAGELLQIVAVPVLQDNYAWLIFDPQTQDAAVVDPGDAAPVLAEAERCGWHVSQAWITHWHPDHTGGLAAIKAAGATITGPGAERDRIPALDTFVGHGDVVRIGAHTGNVLHVPGHTQGHVAFHFADDGVVFTGDTLFAMGCGRLVEGTPEDMWANMERYAAMPADTHVYAGHEYTAANARFAVHLDPTDTTVADRASRVDAMRARGEPTLPTTIADERATNPFMRAGSAARLGELRARKDVFRS